MEGSESTRTFRGRPPKDLNAPHGPEEVTRAVAEAAVRLFAQHGIRQVSIRKVATEAGVNTGLIHRYVGGRTQLVALALRHAGARVEAEAGAGQPDPYLDRRPDARVADLERLLAHLVLEDHDLTGLEVPTVLGDLGIGQVHGAAPDPRDPDRPDGPDGPDDRTARLRAASVLALDLGWRLLHPLVATGTRLTATERAQLWDDVAEARHDLVAHP